MKNNAQEIWGKTVTPRKWRRAVDSVFRHDPSISSTLDNYVRKGANYLAAAKWKMWCFIPT